MNRPVLIACLSFALTAACNDSSSPLGPLDPRVPPPSDPSVAPPPPVPPPFPSLERAGRIYYEVQRTYGTGSSSRYVFHDDSTFTFQILHPHWGLYTVTGVRQSVDETLTLSFDLTTEWKAFASFRGDTLDVRYNTAMQWADFVDGSYLLWRAEP